MAPSRPPPRDETKGEVLRDRLQKTDAALDKQLKSSFVEKFVNGPGAPTDPAGGLFEIVFLDGSGRSGSDVVQIVTDQDTWSFDEDAIEEVLEGDAALPANLLALIQARGLDEDQLARQLMRFFEH